MNDAFFDEWQLRPGETFLETYALYDEAGALIDTAGYQVTAQIRAAIEDVTAVLEISTANGYASVGRLNTGTTNESNLRIAVPPSVTGLIADFGKGHFDILMTDNVGVVDAPIYGYAWYWAAVTR